MRGEVWGVCGEVSGEYRGCKEVLGKVWKSVGEVCWEV